jgi:hypothetical protein
MLHAIVVESTGLQLNLRHQLRQSNTLRRGRSLGSTVSCNRRSPVLVNHAATIVAYNAISIANPAMNVASQ